MCDVTYIIHNEQAAKKIAVLAIYCRMIGSRTKHDKLDLHPGFYKDILTLTLAHAPYPNSSPKPYPNLYPYVSC